MDAQNHSKTNAGIVLGAIRLMARGVVILTMAFMVLVTTGLLLLHTSLVEDRLCIFLSDAASSRLNGTVRIGSLKGTFIRELILEEIVIEGAGREPVISIDHFSVRYLVSRLFSDNIQLDKVVLDGLRVHLSKTDDGAWDIQHLLKNRNNESSKAEDSPLFRLAIDQIEISNSKFRLSASPIGTSGEDMELAVKSLQAGCQWRDDTLALSISDASLASNKAVSLPVELAGKLRYAQSLAKLSLDDVVLKTTGSELTFQGECQFGEDTPEFDLMIVAAPLNSVELADALSLSGFSGGDIEGSLRLSGVLHEIHHEIVVSFGHTRLSEAGLAGYDPDHGLWTDLSCQLLNFDLSEPWFPVGGDISGEVSAQLSLSASRIESLERMEAVAKGDIEGLSLYGFPLDFLQFNAAYSGKVLTFDPVTASAGDTHVGILGTIAPESRDADLDVEISFLNSADIVEQLSLSIPPPFSDLALEEKTDIAIAFSGWLNQAETRFSINTQSVTAAAYHVDGLKSQGLFSWHPDTGPRFEGLQISLTELDGETVSADKVFLNGQWEGGTPTPDMEIEMTARNVEWRQGKVPIREVYISGELTQDHLTVSLNCEHENGSIAEIEGAVSSWDSPLKDIRLQTLGLSTQAPWGEHYLTNLSPVSFSVENGVVSIHECRLGIDDALFSLSGLFSPEESRNLSLSLDNFNLEDLPDILKQNTKLAGSLSGDLTVQGPLSHPSLTSRITIENLTGHDLSWPLQIFLSARYTDAALSFQGDIAQDDTHLLSASGKIPFAISLFPFSMEFPNESLLVTLESNDLKLSELPFPMSETVQWDATTDISLSVSGTIDTPLVNGNIRLFDGMLALPPHELTYETLECSIAVSDNRFQIDRLFIQGDREGRLTSSGTIVLEDRHTLNADLALVGNDFFIPYKESITAKISPDLQLSGSLKAARLSGEVSIAESELDLDLLSRQRYSDIEVIQNSQGNVSEMVLVDAESSVPNFFSALSADILVHIPNNAWINGQDVNAEVFGEITVKKSPTGSFLLSGPLSILRGNYYFMGKDFVLTDGGIEFMGLREIDPKLDITGQTKVDSNTIIVSLNGTASEMVIELSSEPDMEESDIISYLVFGSATDDLGGDQAFNVEKTALSYTGKLLAVELRNLLGDLSFFDAFSIDSSDSDNGFGAVTLGKYLTPKLFVSRRQGLSEGEATYQEIHYELTPQIKLETQIGTDRTGTGDITWEFDF